MSAQAVGGQPMAVELRRLGMRDRGPDDTSQWYARLCHVSNAPRMAK